MKALKDIGSLGAQGDLLLIRVDTIDTSELVEAASDGDRHILYPNTCLLYTSPSPRDRTRSRMPSSA